MTWDMVRNPHVVEIGHLFFFERWKLAPVLQASLALLLVLALTLPFEACCSFPSPSFPTKGLSLLSPLWIAVISWSVLLCSVYHSGAVAAISPWGVEEKTTCDIGALQFLISKFASHFICIIKKHHTKRYWLFIYVKIRLSPF